MKTPEQKLLEAIFGPKEKSGMRARVKQTKPPTLCSTCIRSTIVKTDRAQEDWVIYCHSLEKRIDFRVLDCTSYEVRGALSESQMRQMAWILKLSNDRKSIGFVRPSDDEHKKLRNETDFD